MVVFAETLHELLLVLCVLNCSSVAGPKIFSDKLNTLSFPRGVLCCFGFLDNIEIVDESKLTACVMYSWNLD